MEDSIRAFEDLLVAALAARDRTPRTQESYAFALRLFARFVNKPLDEVGLDDVHAYQRYVAREKKWAPSTFNQTTCALRFFYRECLGKD